MKPPIIITEHGDVSIFESPDDAQMYLEPIDVENGEYQAYDKDGHILNLRVIGVDRPSFFGMIRTKRIKVEEASDKKEHPDELKRILLNFFKDTSIYDQSDESQPLNKLIDKAVNAFGYTR